MVSIESEGLPTLDSNYLIVSGTAGYNAASDGLSMGWTGYPVAPTPEPEPEYRKFNLGSPATAVWGSNSNQDIFEIATQEVSAITYQNGKTMKINSGPILPNKTGVIGNFKNLGIDPNPGKV